MRILFLTRLDFWRSTNTGGKMISKRNYEILKKIYGKDNVFYCGIGYDMDKYYNDDQFSYPIKRNPISEYRNYIFGRYGYSKKVEKEVIAHIERVNPDIIFFDGSWMGGLLKKLMCKNVIVFFHNIEANVSLKSINQNKQIKIQRFFKYWCTKYNEKYISKHANYRICMNQRDSKILRSFYKKDADFYLPTTIIDSYVNSTYTKEKITNILLFVGANFAPNVQGLDWFIKYVLPFIESKLVIVGSGMEKYHPPINDKKIEVVGEVDDLAEYYVTATAVICPIFIGDGMKTKTAEAMMYGKTIFATDEALEGYEIDGTENIYRCNTDREFVNEINAYFFQDNLKLYNENIRKAFLDKYEFNSKYMEFFDWIKEKGLI